VAGAHVPVKPSFETVGKTGAGSPEQKGTIGVKTGTGLGVTVTFKICGGEHKFDAGVNV